MTIQQIQDQVSPVIPSHFRASTQDQLNYLFRKVSSPQIHCVIAMAGQLDADRMARAVRLTMDAEPVLAALYRAVFEVIDPPLGEPFPLVVPINLRRYLPAGHVVPVCTLSGATTVAITRQPGETFDSVAARTHAAMEAIKSDCPGLASAVLLELYFVPGFTPAEYAFYRIIERAAKSGEGYVGLTNPGIIDERQMDFGDIKVAEAYGVGGVAHPPGLGITSSTFRNAMTFTAGFCDTATDRQDVERFLDVFVRELPL